MITPLPGKHTITKADASMLAKRRWEKYRQQAVKRITDEARSVDMTVSSGADAFGLVAARQYQALMDSDKPRIADLEKLGQIMTGQTANSQRENASPPPGTVNLQVDTLFAIAAEIEARQSDAVAKARAIDVEATDTRNE